MTSLFDQLEQVSLRTKGSSDLSSLGVMDVLLDEEPAIFTKSKKDFTPLDKVTHVVIANKFMVLAMANNVLFRMNLHSPSERNEISLNKYTQGKLTNLFLDPTGNHLFLTFASKSKSTEMPELMYLSRKSDKIKTSGKFRGNEFTAIGWNNMNESDSTTGPILLGTSKGLIFETEISLEGDKFFAPSLEQYWRQLPNYLPLYGNKEVDGLVFDIGKNSNTPVTTLEYFQVPGTNKYMIFAATPSRLYYFYGSAEMEEKPVLQQVFQKYLNVPETDIFLASESRLGYSRLQFWSENLITPNQFAWVTEKGIYFGQIDDLKDNRIATVKDKVSLLPYPKPLYEDYSQSPKYPIAIALTEFHILLAYTDSIKGMCLLSKEVVYEDQYNEAFGKLVSVIRDSRTGDIWALSENAMFRFKVHREERNIWQIFCANNQFDLAKKYSRGNEVCYNQVLLKEADMLFEQKEYILSAQRFAEAQSSFEEICLKFLKVDEPDSLKIFLRNKLSALDPKQKTQITMLVVWVVELYLTKLEEIRLQGLEKSASYDEVQKQFETFIALQEVADCIRSNKSTIYELMESHGDKGNLIKLTIVSKDFERLIRHHIFKNNFRDALEVLKSQNNFELYYQFAPVLMQEVPKPLVNTLIDQGKKLGPLRLLPALVSCNGELHSLEVIRYLEFCIVKLKNADKAIHNLLVSLYAKYDSKKLMEYLNSQGQEVSLINYDVYFALRLCAEQQQNEACVKLYALLNLWESAVDLALKVNLELAKTMADMSPENDLELKKKLWLKIAQHVVSEKNDIQEAMKYLSDLIKIEDILPFFSDFLTIDHFKDAICNSLREYNQKIQALKEEMEEATNSAEQVRNEIHSFRNCFTYINSADKCEVCNMILMVRPFYFFPCNHMFHSDCLLAELEPCLGMTKRNRLSDLEKQLESLNTQSNSDNNSTGLSGMTRRDQVKAEIDNIIASECLYCGENMIRNVDKPFIEDFEYESITREWQ
ncbi:vacuolar protein sorting-associated protein 18 homolog isoform X1 [Dendroctonus ponderosae]|uniref:vacuolar protein sorting-associated protein 18 homolog isoform X1 n=1 Tax=Dendroctonus ponderosae TaxID=77166 RepID=UPI002035D821|nr:vacuolar protein sorting-associated protein 18 homolog isoform X1 [Dendroctonus ponderosae]XP_019754049.2 vacuolar protein sorting-associated protein 18 homolog isoform X1 [Dendroctonus ponderosae]